MAGERVLHMNGGFGETSYTNNSLHQKKMILKVKPIIEESLKRMLYCTKFESPLKMADLGCSSGPNSLLLISNITRMIHQAVQNMNCDESPTLQVYLNDLFGNDFNNLFELLPDFYRMMQQERGSANSCFVNATPGNFYGRLFPNNYINFFHSSYSLHWLSQAPRDLTKGSEPLNKGNIYINDKSPTEVYRAYSEQFERDFKVFLSSRSEELMDGGIMVLTFIGRAGEICGHCPWAVLGTQLNYMVLEGLVEGKKLDHFNLPIYGPTAEEVEHVIEEDGSFTIQTLKTFKIGWDADLQEDVDDDCVVIDINTRAEYTSKSIRAVFEPLLEAVFGNDIMDELFSRYANKIAQLMETKTLEYTILVISMTKFLEIENGSSA